MDKEKTIKLSSETHELLKKIKAETGKNIKFLVDTAVKEWWEREKKSGNDPFLAKGQYLDNLAELHDKYRNHGETDGQFRKRILKEFREENNSWD